MTLADLIDLATKAGTLPMQVLMLMAIIILGLVLRRLHNENQKVHQEFIRRIEEKDAAMTGERRERIQMLMEMIRQDTETKADLKVAIEAIKASVDINTRTIERFETLLTKLIGTKVTL